MTEPGPGRVSSPPIMGVYYYPEERRGLITMHESWAIDDGIACYGSFATREEAEDAARRKGYRPVVVQDKPVSAPARENR